MTAVGRLSLSKKGKKRLMQSRMSFFRSTVLEFIFLRVCVTSSTHTRIAYAFALSHVFLVITHGCLCRRSYVSAIGCVDDPHFMEECTSYINASSMRCKPSFLLPKKGGQTHF